MQSGCKGGICGHSASAFGKLVSMPIAALGLSGHCNGYRATVAVICNNNHLRVLAIDIASSYTTFEKLKFYNSTVMSETGRTVDVTDEVAEDNQKLKGIFKDKVRF